METSRPRDSRVPPSRLPSSSVIAAAKQGRLSESALAARTWSRRSQSRAAGTAIGRDREPTVQLGERGARTPVKSPCTSGDTRARPQERRRMWRRPQRTRTCVDERPSLRFFADQQAFPRAAAVRDRNYEKGACTHGRRAACEDVASTPASGARRAFVYRVVRST